MDSNDSNLTYKVIVDTNNKILVKCLVCDIKCDTMDQYTKHETGKNHMKKLEKFNYMHSEIIAKNNVIVNNPTNVSNNSTDNTTNNLNCVICNIFCNNKDQLSNHLKGKAHEKKIKQNQKSNKTTNQSKLECNGSSTQNIIRPEFNGNYFKCSLCHSVSNTLDQYKIHCAGSKHRKKILNTPNAIDDMNLINKVNTISLKDSLRSYTDNMERSFSSEDSKSDSVKSGNSSINLSDEVKDLLNPDVSNINFIKCKLCDTELNTMSQYKIHCNGAKHKRKLKSFGIGVEELNSLNIEDLDSTIDDEEFKRCEVCDIKIHQNNMASHLIGKTHKDKMIKNYDNTNLKLIDLNKDDLNPELEELDLMPFRPRKYQKEIYESALQKDCVIFLPTGTGKTFIAAMIILKMLKENPFHRVVFLVDKVLLVLQQHEFFINQLENITLKRFGENNELETRSVRIIGLANDFINTQHICSLRNHDVIVATAELFRGMLQRRLIYWQDLSLCILDEAHHCVKAHPYNRLLREEHLYPPHLLAKSSTVIDSPLYYSGLDNNEPNIEKDLLDEWKKKRCKIVGLTASPAGETDLESTYKLLKDLLHSLGSVQIVSVENNTQELYDFTSNTKIESLKIDYHTTEMEFRDFLTHTITFLLKKFERYIENNCSLFRIIDSRQTLTVEDIFQIKGQFVNSFANSSDNYKSIFNHIMILFEITDRLDSIGYQAAAHQLQELVNNREELVWFENNSILFVKNSDEILSQFQREQTDEVQSSFIQAILTETKKIKSTNADGTEAYHKILLLVKERKMVHTIYPILQQNCQGYHVIRVVGHGTNNKSVPNSLVTTDLKGTKKDNSKGMSVRHQKKALDFMKHCENQLIIATSVAEEGIDLPECDLIVLANPPNSVQALVQIRGRARKINSRLLMLCRDDKAIADLQDLQNREINIVNSIEKLKNQNLSIHQ